MGFGADSAPCAGGCGPNRVAWRKFAIESRILDLNKRVVEDQIVFQNAVIWDYDRGERSGGRGWLPLLARGHDIFQKDYFGTP